MVSWCGQTFTYKSVDMSPYLGSMSSRALGSRGHLAVLKIKRYRYYTAESYLSALSQQMLSTRDLKPCLYLRFFTGFLWSCDSFGIKFLISFNTHFIAKKKKKKNRRVVQKLQI